MKKVILATTLLKDHKTLVRDVTSRHGELCASFDGWKTSAQSVLTFLEGEAVNRGALLMEPHQYAEFITKTNHEQFLLRDNTHAGSIRLCGSMVGFAFLLPSSLRQHACRAQSHFATIKLLGTDLKQRDGQDMFWFSVFLVAQTVRQMWDERCCVRRLVANGHTIMIDIRYVPHDLLAAVIDLPNKALAVLQALDAGSFKRILEGVGAIDWTKKRYQLGFQFNNEPSEADEYSRYSRALDHIWCTYSGRSEVWLLHSYEDGARLKVWNPRWKGDVERAHTLQSKDVGDFERQGRIFTTEFPPAANGDRYVEGFLARQALAEVSVPEAIMTSFLTDLVTQIPARNSDIRTLLDVFSVNSHLFAGIREAPFT